MKQALRCQLAEGAAGSVYAQLPQEFKHKVLPPGVNVWHRTPIGN